MREIILVILIIITIFNIVINNNICTQSFITSLTVAYPATIVLTCCLCHKMEKASLLWPPMFVDCRVRMMVCRVLVIWYLHTIQVRELLPL